MKIGELAKLTNCHVETIRYYQKVGLLFKAQRMENGYGYYSPRHLAHLRLIRNAKGLGFPQKEILQLVSLLDSKETSCDKVRPLADRQLRNVLEKIEVLEEIKSTLTNLMESCENKVLEDCSVLTEFSG